MRCGFLLGGLAAVALAGPGGAGPHEDPIAVVEHIFEAADRDGDGTLTREEYAAARLERFGVGFDECDADADGATTLAEYLDVYFRHHPSKERARI